MQDPRSLAIAEWLKRRFDFLYGLPKPAPDRPAKRGRPFGGQYFTPTERLQIGQFAETHTVSEAQTKFNLAYNTAWNYRAQWRAEVKRQRRALG